MWGSVIITSMWYVIFEYKVWPGNIKSWMFSICIKAKVKQTLNWKFWCTITYPYFRLINTWSKISCEDSDSLGGKTEEWMPPKSKNIKGNVDPPLYPPENANKQND